ncbi:MAG TPA: prolyl oligopeptidase [Planctomycetaceae bacterium]|nr:prolyl oligopeptidase [Planctomycetaceae bacterium]HBC63383.1 prolyl oligopeptidase [Planctomycetaceae bacterium]
MRKLVCLTVVMWSVVCSGGVSTCLLADDAAESEASLPATLQYDIPSSLDGKSQPILAWAPDTAKVQKTPLFVFLHSWSSDYTQDNSKWLKACAERGWIWLHPNFRGINQSPQACGSRLARQDILDAIEHACELWQVDRERIYLAGVSGGGHMSLLMAGHHPERFSAISAWVGPTDLAQWHRFHTQDGKPGKYAKMIEKSLLGAPGTSPEIDAEYRDRSPVYHLHQATTLPVSIWAGVEDGHTGSVPVSHSLWAFNAVCRGLQRPEISDLEIQQLVRDRQLQQPTADDMAEDVELGRKIFLRRRAGPSVVTIFDGGHESLPPAAMAWLSRQQRIARAGE